MLTIALHVQVARLGAVVLSLMLLLVATEPLAAERGARDTKSDAAQAVREMREARTPAEEAARVLVEKYRQSPEQALRLLASAYPGRNAATAALEVLRMRPEQAAEVLRRARVPAEDVTASFRKARVRDEEAARSLHQAGYPAKEATRAVMATSRLEGAETYELLRAAGYDSRHLDDAVAELGVPVDLDCVGPDGLPAPCGTPGAGAPAMGQVTWSPTGSGQTGGIVVFESTNIPAVDVLFDGQELHVLERTPSRVRARLPSQPGSGALALRRRSDGVVGVIEDPYQVVSVAPPDPPQEVDWLAVADAAREGAMEDADAWIRTSRFDASRCTVKAAVAIGKAGVLVNDAGFEGAVEDSLLEAGAPAELAAGWQEVFEDAFLEWADGVTIPGLPWYPALAAYPGAEAPPTPNVPTPLVSLPSKGQSAMTSGALARALSEGLPGAEAPEAQQAIQLFAAELGQSFLMFLTAASVHSVMGEGPVPTFQPGAVPAGPVDGSCSSKGLWTTMLPSGMELAIPLPSDFQ